MTEQHRTASGLFSELEAALEELARIGRRMKPASEDFDKIHALVSAWLPLAEERRRQASGSGTDQNRWSQLLTGPAAHMSTGVGGYPEWRELTAHARSLLLALRDTWPPYPRVADVVARIKQRIDEGAYVAGSVVPVSGIAADLCAPVSSVELAAQDLHSAGLVRQQRPERVLILDAGGSDRIGQITVWIRHLITVGVYQADERLPAQRVLARRLVSDINLLKRAIHQLLADGTLGRDHASTRVRAHGHPRPQPVNPPLLPASPAADHDWGWDQVHAALRQARHWWSTRTAPPTADLQRCVALLHTVSTRAVIRARQDSAAPPAAHTLARQVEVTGTALHHRTHGPYLWLLACWGAALQDLLLHLYPEAQPAPAATRTSNRSAAGHAKNTSSHTTHRKGI